MNNYSAGVNTIWFSNCSTCHILYMIYLKIFWLWGGGCTFKQIEQFKHLMVVGAWEHVRGAIDGGMRGMVCVWLKLYVSELPRVSICLIIVDLVGDKGNISSKALSLNMKGWHVKK